MNRILVKACNRAGFHPQISVVCNDIECYEKFLKCNMGIGIGRQSKDSAETISGVVDLDVCDFKERYTLYAYYAEKEYYGKVISKYGEDKFIQLLHLMKELETVLFFYL